MRASSPMVVALDARLIQGTSTGDSTYWTSLVAGLSQLEGDFRVLLLSREAEPGGLGLDSRFQWVRVPARSSRWWSMVAFPLAARRLGASVIHTQYSLSPLVGRVGVTTIHDVSFLIGPEWFRAKDRFLLSRGVPAAARRAARVLTVSETSKREVESLIPASAGKVVATPLACPAWVQRVDRDVAKARVAETLGLQGPFVLTVGTRWPRKNMQLAVHAVGLLPESMPLRLVVTGKQGWGSEDLGARGLAAGYVDEGMLSCLYSAADMYLAPSRHEGFGIPVLEAFRCGCPVLCSSGGALPEVAGDAAIVERSWEAADWARTLMQVLGDASKLESLRGRGWEREKLFSWRETAQRTLEVYREVAR